MTWTVFNKLLVILIAVAIGWIVGRMRWLGESDEQSGQDPARVLSNVAFYIFVPALLFRTTARIDVATLPWLTLAAFFIPVVLLLTAVYTVQRRRRRLLGMGVAGPSVQAITATFGNTLQVGVPVAAGIFGEPGLAIHITVVSLHALVLLSVTTALVELDLGRAAAASHGQSLWKTLGSTVRNTVIHPVVLPVMAGWLWNSSGLALPPLIDEVLVMLSTAVVPLCLTLIGTSLAYYGWPRAWRSTLGLATLKLLLLPVLVLLLAHWGLGLSGLPLAVIVMIAALPVGSNALIFAQRYQTLETETTAVTVLSTLLYVLSAPVWIALLAWIG